MRLIDADALRKQVDDIHFRDAIDNSPTILPNPKFGKWYFVGKVGAENRYQCSCCGSEFTDSSKRFDSYCSDCGARMRP